ncbi:GPR1/FUN34/YaaH family transporter [Desulfosporosinus sp. BG]|uniref:acetate uptake transporter n=1 Tax=Desulfosporosinus sp. BG TaxID=1633135 RepID=UPI00083A2E48|nr:GPR1/FUN34/YaaH family transporter [Desulfosporosinus sp. BG]ODA42348.1 putative regulatory protein [Desulfosporosinus sp. BG]
MSIQEVKVNYSGADPTAFGVLGLAMICLIASTSKLGFTDHSATGLLVVWACLLGGIVQIMAAKIDFQKGNVLGGTALGAYGFFWVGMAFSWLTMNGAFGPGMKAAVDPKMLGFVFLGYLIFSLFTTVAALEVNVPFVVLFLFIDVLFFSLSAVTFNVGPAPMFTQLAGWSELIVSIIGFYYSAAIFYKNFYGREILPLGRPLNVIKKSVPAPAVPDQRQRARA